MNESRKTHSLERINRRLRKAGVVCADRLIWFEHIDSTNSYLMARQEIHGRVCLTELQTAGRGRRGRRWRAPPSSSILLSMGWRLGDAATAGLSLVSGLAIVDALAQAGVDGVGLKWPNDLIADGRKLGGVLTELNGAYCVIGMGVNINVPLKPEDHIDQPWVDVRSLGHRVDRDLLAAYLIISHCRYLERFCRAGFDPFVDKWNRLNVHQGMRASVELSGQCVSGRVEGVDRQGALVLDQDGVRRRIVSGQVSLRPQ